MSVFVAEPKVAQHAETHFMRMLVGNFLVNHFRILSFETIYCKRGYLSRSKNFKAKVTGIDAAADSTAIPRPLFQSRPSQTVFSVPSAKMML